MEHLHMIETVGMVNGQESLMIDAGPFTGVFAPLPLTEEQKMDMRGQVAQRAMHYLALPEGTPLIHGEDMPLNEIQDAIRAHMRTEFGEPEMVKFAITINGQPVELHAAPGHEEYRVTHSTIGARSGVPGYESLHIMYGHSLDPAMLMGVMMPGEDCVLVSGMVFKVEPNPAVNQ